MEKEKYEGDYTPHKMYEEAEEYILNENEDNVENPSHYTFKKTCRESIDVIDAVMERSEWRGFLWGNVLKYIIRWPKKNGVEDLKKAKVYLDWLITAVEMGDE